MSGVDTPILQGRHVAASATTIYQEALAHAAFYVHDHCQQGEEHAQVICELKIPSKYIGVPAASAVDLKPYTYSRNRCNCHPETCCCDAWAVLNPDGSMLCGAYDAGRAKKMAEQLNHDNGRSTAKGAVEKKEPA